jgi:hypothetical protein
MQTNPVRTGMKGKAKINKQRAKAIFFWYEYQISKKWLILAKKASQTQLARVCNDLNLLFWLILA